MVLHRARRRRAEGARRRRGGAGSDPGLPTRRGARPRAARRRRRGVHPGGHARVRDLLDPVRLNERA
ncbi:MAG: hypothetical protein ABI175_16325 [Polyangiales bacterium]